MSGEHAEVCLGAARKIGETEKAYKVRLIERNEVLWVPKSQVTESSDIRTPRPHEDQSLGREGDLYVSLWWAEKDGRA